MVIFQKDKNYESTPPLTNTIDFLPDCWKFFNETCYS